ncbi:MAG: restriction endonuclease [Ignavibacteria bacterium]
MAKTNITRTYGTIHFEDLDPHRFEDLIRELIYDFKDWQTIEATGRSGNDEGFDIRAYEKVNINNHNDDEDKDEDENRLVHPMDGNLWMIQGKREKTITPKKIKEILEDVDSENPPYGYILAASSNFSKDSYDVFREELKKKGVMEFYLWGKGELEDMLHMPKNDRILFTFFGISLLSKKRLRKTEIRSMILTKNKLFKLFGGWNDLYNEILVRDMEDTHYPYDDDYIDFEENPRWKKYTATDVHPLGLICHNHKYFAYIDIRKKEYDYSIELDFMEERRNEDKRKIWSNNFDKIKEFWDFLPKNNQAYLKLDGLIKFENIYIVDEKGDSISDYPPYFFLF